MSELSKHVKRKRPFLYIPATDTAIPFKCCKAILLHQGPEGKIVTEKKFIVEFE